MGGERGFHVAQASDSGPLALPVEEGIGLPRQRGSPGDYPNIMPSPQAAPSGLKPAMSPRRSAEMAQAMLFDEMLCAEIVRLQQHATSMVAQCRRRRDPGGGHQPPEELMQLRAWIEEAHVLLEALRHRFPRGSSSDEASTLK